MKITKESSSEISAIIKVELTPEDYKPQVDKVLKEHQKKANMPGFRPGHVPLGVIKKMYGISVIGEEVNKLMIDHLYKYLNENKIDILGSPLINREKTKLDNISEDINYEFYYDLGLSPAITIDLAEAGKLKYYDITVNDGVVEKYIHDISRRYGKFSTPEAVEDNDLVYGEFEELDEKGEVLENGIKNISSISLEFLKNEAGKKLLLGVKKDDILTLEMSQISNSTDEASSMLNIEKEKAADLKSKFRFKVSNISRIEPAELNEELFEKVYRNKNITTEEQLREEILKDAQVSFAKESDRMFMNHVVEMLIDSHPVTLPDEFLKRYIIETNEKVTPEELEKQYPDYVKTMKWQLIENEIIKKYELRASEKDMHDYVEEYIKTQFSAVYKEEIPEERIHQMVHRIMENKEEMQKVTDKYYDEKLLEVFKSNLKIDHKEVTYEDFIKLAAEKK